jgi:hypothetical protein
MGKGATLIVKNASGYKLYVEHEYYCIYEDHMGPFNGEVIENRTEWGPGYVEAKASSSGGDFCASQPSHIKFFFNRDSGCWVDFTEYVHRWTADGGNDANSDIEITASASEDGDGNYTLSAVITPKI